MKKHNIPSIVWLKVTDYIHGWLQHELGGSLRVKDQKVICVQHLHGARDIFRMDTVRDLLLPETVGNSMSDTWKNCIEAGLELDPESIQKNYGITKGMLELFVPIECPRMCITENGVLRPWSLDVNFGRRQSAAMQRLLRDEFWNAVTSFNRQYAARRGGSWYPAVDMIEDFCAETGTQDLYVEALRREWQRRVKRIADGVACQGQGG